MPVPPAVPNVVSPTPASSLVGVPAVRKARHGKQNPKTISPKNNRPLPHPAQPPARPQAQLTPCKYTQRLEQYTAALLHHYRSNPKEKRFLLEKALKDAKNHHQGQQRKAGGPYLLHPLRVALMAARAGMDIETAMVALLHDVIEDTEVTKQEIEASYGQWIANAIDGLTKVHAQRKTYQSTSLTTYRKLLTSTIADWCVLQVKLFDRLDNMRDLYALSRSKQIRISEETLNIYAPIAQRLGMENIAKQLINLGFKHRYPMRWAKTQRALAKNIWRDKTKAHGIADSLRKILYDAGIQQVRIQSLFQPLSNFLLSVKPPRTALLGFRLIVEDNAQCYQAMGALHAPFRVTTNSIRDYISNPKPNHYRGLCSQVFIGGEPMTMHYVSTKGHRVNTIGLLAQWQGDKEEINRYFRSHLELLDSVDADQLRMEDVLRHAQMETLQVFTPRGQLLHFPRGSTVLDFAFAIHSNLGLHCIGGRISNQTYSPFTQLKDGEVVEVLTHPSERVEAHWLDHTRTTKARLALKRHLRIRSQAQMERIGTEILVRQANQANLVYAGDIFDLPQLKAHLTQLALTPQQVKERLADGRLKAYALLVDSGVIPKKLPLASGRSIETWAKNTMRKWHKRKPNEQPLLEIIPGLAGHHATATCCHPLPCDVIVGVQSHDAFTLHRQDCTWLQTLPSKHLLPAAWKPSHATTPINTLLTLKHSGLGMMYGVTKVCKLLGINILHMQAEEKPNQFPTMRMCIPAQSLGTLTNMFKRLRKLPFVKHIYIQPTSPLPPLPED